MLAVVLPKLPPFASADSFVRSLLYEQAAIPAQQFRELQRFKEAAFIPDKDMLEKVRTCLQVEGFNVDDLHYDETPSTRSLWTKTSLLIRHIENWMAQDRYQTAFAVLKEINDTRRSVDVLNEMYTALMGDAITILQERRLHPGDTMSEHEHQFRESVKTLLYHTYNLLSRVSLHAHFSEMERVNQMRRIGIQIERRSLSHAPDANDLVMLLLIVGAVFVLPLSLSMDNSALAPLIGIIIYSAVLLPIVIASELPMLTTIDPESSTPNVAFPVLCGLSAALFSALLICAYFYTDLRDIEMVAGKYYLRSPWAIIHAGIAVLVAWRMLANLSPAELQARISHRSPPPGSTTDAAIFLFVSLVLMAIVITLLNKLGTAPKNIWRPFLIIGVASAVIGYFVPSWYRTNNRDHNNRRTTSEKRVAFDSKLRRHLTAS